MKVWPDADGPGDVAVTQDIPLLVRDPRSRYLPAIRSPLGEPRARSSYARIAVLMDNLEPEGWERVGVSAALAKSYAGDEREFLALLGTLMESALDTETRIERRGLFGGGSIRRIVIALGDYTYVIENSGRGPLTAARKRLVRGVAVKTEEMRVPEWIDALGAAIEERATTSQRARDALSRLIGGG